MKVPEGWQNLQTCDAAYRQWKEWLHVSVIDDTNGDICVLLWLDPWPC
jgi:hypothetical protein